MARTVARSALLCLICWAVLAPAYAGTGAVLARVEMTAAVRASGLPVHELLQDGAGRGYALVLAAHAALDASDCAFTILATNAAAQDIVIARTRRPAVHAELARAPECLYDDGRHVVLRRTAAFMARRAQYDVMLRALPRAPLQWDVPAPRAAAFSCVSNPAIAAMINAVTSNRVWQVIAQLSGEIPFTVGASSYTMYSRHTRNGSPFQKDAAYILQSMTNLGYATQYFRWSRAGYVSSNVIAVKTGTTLSNEIVLLVAHLDNMPSSGRAPGADDNASGCAALVLAAEQCAPHTFQRTLQFAFVTGEEQDLYGSAAYATALTAQAAHVVAVFNFDMVAYSTQPTRIFGVHTRLASHPRYAHDLPLAQLYTNVMKTYAIDAANARIVADGELYSDHASFWDRGYPAVLAIEDYDDFNDDYYHTSNDRLQYCNPAYCTAVIKGAVGTAAHAAQLVPEPGAALAWLAMWCLLQRAARRRVCLSYLT